MTFNFKRVFNAQGNLTLQRSTKNWNSYLHQNRCKSKLFISFINSYIRGRSHNIWNPTYRTEKWGIVQCVNWPDLDLDPFLLLDALVPDGDSCTLLSLSSTTPLFTPFLDVLFGGFFLFSTSLSLLKQNTAVFHSLPINSVISQH